MIRSKILGVSIVAMGALMLCSMPMAAADSAPQAILQHARAFGSGHVTIGEAPPPYGLHLANPVHRIPKPYVAPVRDSAAQSEAPFSPEFSLNYHVLGVGVGFPNYSVPDAPPDTTAAVGDTEVVEGVNVSMPISTRARAPLSRSTDKTAPCSTPHGTP